ncbi:MAG: translation initiation factor IF-2 [bacterium]|nr:translation initiation factor IF-2 [bacterium]
MKKEKQENPKQNFATRPPVVVVLGHIDHGKSSLLEAIKDFKITAKESGGITQHIGAYQIEEQGKKITFLDTPGHEAFSQMRSRGVKVADIAILVIDAGEGVKAQTKEAISHIKKAEIPFIIALSKTDKPEANPQKVKRELVQEDILVESMGGKIPSVEISAKTKKGIPELLEVILLLAEMEGLKSEPKNPGQGAIIESYLDSLRGPTATLLLIDGTLKSGDIVATPSAFTKIKSLENFQKKSIREAFPSDPVIVFGFSQAPKVGEEFKVFPDMKAAEENLQPQIKKKSISIIEVLEGQRVLNLILKTDVLGSCEAIEGILDNLPQEKVILKILKSEVGDINESDIKIAQGNRALVLGFRVKIGPGAKILAEKEKIRIIIFEVIYELVEEVRKFMEKITKPTEVRQDLGKMKVLARFFAEKNRQIIGGRVIEGEVRKGSQVEVFRAEEKIGQGKMVNLQRSKKDAESVSKGEECGVLFEGDTRIEDGDVLQFYIEERRKSEL